MPPGVCGLVDGTLIQISFPSWEADHQLARKFWCRKQYFAWNAMGICDHNLRLLHFSADDIGSAHDSRVFKVLIMFCLNLNLLNISTNNETYPVLVNDKG